MKQLGNAAHLLGIRPWEWELLTWVEADQMLDWLEKYEAKMKEAR